MNEREQNHRKQKTDSLRETQIVGFMSMNYKKESKEVHKAQS